MPATKTRSARVTRPKKLSSEAREKLERHARQLLNTEIAFIPNRSFHKASVARQLLNEDHLPSADGGASDLKSTASSSLPKDLPGHLARLCATSLLTADEERELFRRMNFLKFRANALRSSLDPSNPDAETIAAIDSHIAEAAAIRDRIIQANMRLVIAIVKKFVTPRHSFDDLLSDGTMSLMQAVDKFDFDRGFRFSTYAYRAIARNAYRAIMDQRKASRRFMADTEVLTEEAIDEGSTASMDEQTWSRLRNLLSGMMHQLDRRERFILRGRYALGSHRRVRTFQCLADKLGVSKERVRQLEQRALTKLQALAANIDTDQ
ncbi:MAG: sigma-70 family RNA polymerase sigma factor [Planctomycetales bacterium]|nr:sigma-70 family RNA polymerase sigma factor [Planctomycetales bacterium]